ncbi:HlyD family secretion protein [Kaistia terrae]|uniref:HlyD family secretion protein n=1 Tax=Kaistia terrae TaxID=537017 RepID=A0ABW0PV18_9HYPH|nr:HlyD family efflux transporter periplasmic adaptor subunit [Kaistia terrae]MCX5579499.1 efflux RND transporter periplasmic adaptor subunit [Kaistia terrae]
MAKVALVETPDDTGVSELEPIQLRKTEATPPSPATPLAERPSAPGESGTAKPAIAVPPAKRGGRRRFLLLTVAAVAIAAGAYFGHEWWTVGRFMVSTDDAYVGADTSTVAPRLSGYVTKVAIANNSAVKSGDPLVYLDDSDQKLAVTAAENQIAAQQAAVARIDKQIEAGQAGVEQARTSIASANADAELAVADLARASTLAKNQFASQQSLQQAQATKDKTAAAVESAKAGLTTAEANVAVMQAQRVEAERALDQYQTTLDQKKLDLDHMVIRAPFDGVVGNRAVDPGEYVATGQRLLAVVPLQDVYVDANYKETQLGRIRPGASATVSVDAYSDATIEGTVESVAPASGAVFSLLPADNATGNFTKITQRVPVRIRIPASEAAKGNLRPGLSVVVEIDSRTGDGAVAANN